MKTYVRLLDFVIVVLLILSVYFNINDRCMAHYYTNRAGLSRTLIISWQSLLLYASFCVFLRYVVTREEAVEK